VVEAGRVVHARVAVKKAMTMNKNISIEKQRGPSMKDLFVFMKLFDFS
jgi:hypothetical protein